MKHFLLLKVAVLLSSLGLCQNLVPNYSFENYSACPPGSIVLAVPWKGGATSSLNAEYGNSCSPSICCGVPTNIYGYGYQYARTGNAYIGMYFRFEKNRNFRNYIQVKLIDSLKSGNCYYVEFFVNLYNVASFSVNNIGLLISDTFVVQQFSTPINANPQIVSYGNPVIPIDTLNWRKVAGIFVAKGGEQYITIGNFKDDANTDTIPTNFPIGIRYGAYYVDDVSVYSLADYSFKADAGPDTTLVTGDSVFVGTLLGGTITTTWYNSTGQVIANNVPGLYVQPTQNTFYILEQNVCGSITRDTVNVTVNPLPLQWLNFSASVVAGERLSEDVALHWQTANEENVSHFTIQRSYSGINEFENVGQVKAKNRPWNEYSYMDQSMRNARQAIALYRLQSTDKDGKSSYSAIRRVVFPTHPLLLTIYPNPAKDIITVVYPNLKSLVISDVTGRVVADRKYAGDNEVDINISQLIKGVYFVKVIGTNGNIVSQKLVIE